MSWFNRRTQCMEEIQGRKPSDRKGFMAPMVVVIRATRPPRQSFSLRIRMNAYPSWPGSLAADTPCCGLPLAVRGRVGRQCRGFPILRPAGMVTLAGETRRREITETLTGESYRYTYYWTSQINRCFIMSDIKNLTSSPLTCGTAAIAPKLRLHRVVHD
jgi:hypothetical protein